MGRALEARRGGGRGEAGCDVGIGMVVSVIYTFPEPAHAGCGITGWHARFVNRVSFLVFMRGAHAGVARGRHGAWSTVLKP